jgi:UDP-N-acetylglucosamine/UDP-N-acetylgalactosamine diphosphorylase
MAQGVIVPDPTSVHIAADVHTDRIHAGAVLHPGCRIQGPATSIGPGCEIGEEGPVTLRDCQLDARVTIRGGYLHGATLLEGADCGDGSHVRPGSLLEEYAAIAHSNGLKQTILMPFVTIGSLTNFCDVLMAGGTGDGNHSEVGSSYVHFNFTPHQDKATASLIGDVPRGALLDQAPIFLGGQGGIAGPCSVAYGTVIAAGIVVRKDIEQENMLLMAAGGAQRVVMRPYAAAIFGPVERIVANNLAYIGNLLALRAWYRYARSPFLRKTAWGQACLDGALSRLQEGYDERVKRLGQLTAKLSQSVQRAASEGQRTDLPPFVTQERFATAWPTLHAAMGERAERGHQPPMAAADILRRMSVADRPFIDAVQALPADDKPVLRHWLQSIVDEITGLFHA